MQIGTALKQSILNELQTLVRDTARRELLTRFQKVGYTLKEDGSILTEADLAMHHALKRSLTWRWPEVNFLSEEMSTEEQQELLNDTERPLWCLDPLDGTSNFAAGVPIFGVCLALIREGRPVIGIIYDPIRDESFCAAEGEGTYLNGQRLRPNVVDFAFSRAIALVDFKRLKKPLASRLIQQVPFGSQRNIGSCAIEWSWMAAGRGHIYLHGGQKLWDLAAGWLILNEAGGHSQTLDAETVFRPGINTRSVVAAHDHNLFKYWVEWLNSE
ncbi:MAG: inositol monophosphatase family protein [Gammaproteobacteria bacterium]|nr:inositol monophosphatase family protein [Gammaproteobacteria bacterium]